MVEASESGLISTLVQGHSFNEEAHTTHYSCMEISQSQSRENPVEGWLYF